MNAQHTPGPWKYSFEGSNPDWAIVTSAGGAIVANVNCETGPDAISSPATRKMPADANAKLIAAAPDLLEACKAMLARCCGEYPDHPETIALIEAIRKATA
jgi:hypothetical protein